MDYIYEMPEEMLKECEHKGRVERLEYDSRTYEEGDDTVLHKGAWVYVPYGYNENRKYNILYLLHGGGFREEWWFKMFPNTATILDNMIDKGICDPCIIVTPTFYRSEEDKDAGHGVNEDRPEQFHNELRKDLIPAAEKNYSTYCNGDVSDENLVATREHRAFAGLSLGSMTTYRAAFYRNFDLFSWYGPFSGCSGPFGDHNKEVKRICETLENGHKNGFELDYMFCCNGDKDIAYAEHDDIMKRAVAESPYLIPGKNYDFYVIPGGVHDMNAWQLHLYHALQIFFKKDTLCAVVCYPSRGQ